MKKKNMRQIMIDKLCLTKKEKDNIEDIVKKILHKAELKNKYSVPTDREANLMMYDMLKYK